MSKDLTERTAGEELWLWRKKKGWGQLRAAKHLGVGRTTYWTYERDQQPAPLEARRKERRHELRLLLGLARRRSGLTLRAVAARAGCSHVILLQRERDGDAGLRAWWESRGYKFG